MVEVHYTEEQKRIIEHEGNNLLVSASAGSGKTMVLIEHILFLIKEKKVSLNQLLVVTFTNDAANEMKQRLKALLQKAIQKEAEKEQKRWLQDQLVKLPSAMICTIDSFCLQVLQKYYYLLELDPKIQLLTEKVEQMEMQEETFDIWFEEQVRLQKHPLLFQQFQDLAALQRVFVMANQELDAAADEEALYQQWLYWFDHKEEYYQQKLLSIAKEMSFFLSDNAFAIEGTSFFEKGTEIYQQFCQALEGKQVWSEVPKGLRKPPKIELKGANPFTNTALKEDQKLLKEAFEPQKEEEISKELAIELLESIYEIRQLEKEWRKKKGVSTFSDVAKNVQQLLQEQPELVRLYQEQFVEVIVDEYQDVNDLQENILSTISRGNNYFMVGDAKQSIYQFRKANPHNFIAKRTLYLEDQQKGEVISLRDNFRSRKEVLDFANAVFEKTMTEAFGGISYDEKEALRSGATYTQSWDATTEWLTCKEIKVPEKWQETVEESKELQDAFFQEGKLDEKKLQAHLIAQSIQEQLEKEIYIQGKEENHPLSYHDIAILSRSNVGLSIVENILAKYKIPTVRSKNMNYFQAIEVQQVLALLEIIENPYQNIPFVAVLRSPFVRMKEQELMDLRHYQKEGEGKQSVYLQAKAWAEKDERLAQFLEQLAFWQQRKRNISVRELLWDIYEQTQIVTYQLAFDNGEQRQRNLSLLYEQAEAFEALEYRGLSSFLRYVRRLVKNNKELEGIQKENAVILQTIHGSKGLEYPFVYLYQMDQSLQLKNNKDLVIFSNKNHLGLKYRQISDFAKEKEQLPYQKTIRNYTYQAVAEEAKKEYLEEELRILYVAITRAREKLFIVGFGKEEEIEARETVSLPLEKNNSFMNWILAASSATYHFPWKKKEQEIEQIFRNFWEQKQKKLEFITTVEPVKEKVAEKTWREVEAILLQKYHYEAQTEIQSYQSVSHLKHEFSDPDIIQLEERGASFFKEKSTNWKEPNWQESQKEVTRAQLGSAMHLLLQYLDWTKDITLDTFIELGNELVHKGKLDILVAQKLDYTPLLKFVDSPLGQFFKEHQAHLYCEQAFSGLFPVEGENVLVHGIIDGYIVLEDWVLLYDYKTNLRRKYERKDAFKKRMKDEYFGQLRLYAKALQSTYPEKKIVPILILLSENDWILVEEE